MFIIMKENSLMLRFTRTNAFASVFALVLVVLSASFAYAQRLIPVTYEDNGTTIIFEVATTEPLQKKFLPTFTVVYNDDSTIIAGNWEINPSTGFYNLEVGLSQVVKGITLIPAEGTVAAVTLKEKAPNGFPCGLSQNEFVLSLKQCIVLLPNVSNR